MLYTFLCLFKLNMNKYRFHKCIREAVDQSCCCVSDSFVFCCVVFRVVVKSLPSCFLKHKLASFCLFTSPHLSLMRAGAYPLQNDSNGRFFCSDKNKNKMNLHGLSNLQKTLFIYGRSIQILKLASFSGLLTRTQQVVYALITFVSFFLLLLTN